MFSRVLIANRGEIAVRIQQTLQAMGIATVAVYADPDISAPHVAMANAAYPLHGDSAKDTYLNVGELLEVARESGAEAVHPGYGFLSESPAFARACAAAGLVFIGPTPDSMEALGDKVRSKEIAALAGVPTVPSSAVLDGVGADAQGFVEQWGFPLLVKAAAGGGGRGMRLVDGPDQLAQALESASREAQAAFGDGRVFLERYLQHPRHIEFQILADGRGHVIHLLERECSIQRRHQKLIEETPSPAMSPDLRRRMGEAAVALAKAAGYVNAGTAEFLLDPDTEEFYFLEVNARLQVEHPVTEAILGMDIVAWQARIAAGEALDIAQEDVRSLGHAIECRIYAEDPYSGFLPSTGRLLRWRPPTGPGLRLDSGVDEGYDVSSHYDALLAKLVAWGPDREASLKRMEGALRRFPVLGLVTNVPFLRRVVTHSGFTTGAYNTAFLDDNPDLLQAPQITEKDEVARSLGAWATANRTSTAARSPSLAPVDDGSPWRQAGPRRLP
ncbi:MAG: propionyl-CoA carboxylase alpha chain [Chloroflexi bacterium]|jgi:acetyl/propionyl-CoA carboxylase alpha subunit|nr:MAG: propionyl-CoA carboxylase alpha chain [Chloroflexota bacterium]